MYVLGIESSCDETGLAIYESTRGLVANALFSQIELHAPYGGVIPEIASRDHIKKLTPLFKEALQQAEITQEQLGGIAYTAGPGLMGALLGGVSFAKGLAFGLQIPAIGVHHLEAHLLAPMLEDPKPAFPFLALLVSGGHTMLILAHDFNKYEILGETLDDAVGEAFDKTAKLLGFAYPGGPHLARLADECLEKSPYKFPRPMTDRPGLEFSFSGLKTHALQTWQKSAQDEKAKRDIASAFQTAIVETLTIKIKRALQSTGVKQLVVSGGVSANKALRAHLANLSEEWKVNVFFPRMEFCTDNGAMVAYLGHEYLSRGLSDATHALEAHARWSLPA